MHATSQVPPGPLQVWSEKLVTRKPAKERKHIRSLTPQRKQRVKVSQGPVSSGDQPPCWDGKSRSPHDTDPVGRTRPRAHTNTNNGWYGSDPTQGSSGWHTQTKMTASCADPMRERPPLKFFLNTYLEAPGTQHSPLLSGWAATSASHHSSCKVTTSTHASKRRQRVSKHVVSTVTCY